MDEHVFSDITRAVRNYLSEAISKLGAKNRVEAANRAGARLAQ